MWYIAVSYHAMCVNWNNVCLVHPPNYRYTICYGKNIAWNVLSKKFIWCKFVWQSFHNCCLQKSALQLCKYWNIVVNRCIPLNVSDNTSYFCSINCSSTYMIIKYIHSMLQWITKSINKEICLDYRNKHFIFFLCLYSFHKFKITLTEQCKPNVAKIVITFLQRVTDYNDKEVVIYFTKTRCNIRNFLWLFQLHMANVLNVRSGWNLWCHNNDKISVIYNNAICVKWQFTTKNQG